VLFGSPAGAQGLSKLAIDVAAGGGFAGLRSSEVQTVPHTTCNSGQPPVCTVDSSVVKIIANSTYGWQPAIATGLVFRYVPHPARVGTSKSGEEVMDGIGVGLGAQFVFVPRDDTTRAAPAITVHVGKSSQQVFFGVIFAPSDRAELPGGGKSAVVPVGFDAAGLIRPNGGNKIQFFAGVVIGGVAVTQPGR
jgi:hypothetical protein